MRGIKGQVPLSRNARKSLFLAHCARPTGARDSRRGRRLISTTPKDLRPVAEGNASRRPIPRKVASRRRPPETTAQCRSARHPPFPAGRSRKPSPSCSAPENQRSGHFEFDLQAERGDVQARERSRLLTGELRWSNFIMTRSAPDEPLPEPRTRWRRHRRHTRRSRGDTRFGLGEADPTACRRRAARSQAGRRAWLERTRTWTGLAVSAGRSGAEPVHVVERDLADGERRCARNPTTTRRRRGLQAARHRADRCRCRRARRRPRRWPDGEATCRRGATTRARHIDDVARLDRLGPQLRTTAA